jgi:hypothetical protein
MLKPKRNYYERNKNTINTIYSWIRFMPVGIEVWNYVTKLK